MLREALDMARCALPQCCALCGAAAGTALLCAPCREALPRLGLACPSCALPTVAGACCGACLTAPPPQERACAVFVYAFPVDRLLQRLKYGGALALADWAADELATTIALSALPLPDALVALPLGQARQRERGFNQAGEIARRVGARLELPERPWLVRVRESLPQTGLPWAARATNVKRAFSARPEVRGVHVAVVDDVMTTGATLREAALALRAAGAARVSTWAVARTLPPGAASSPAAEPRE